MCVCVWMGLSYIIFATGFFMILIEVKFAWPISVPFIQITRPAIILLYILESFLQGFLSGKNHRAECGVSRRFVWRGMFFVCLLICSERRAWSIWQSHLKLCGNMSLTDGEKLGITISEDETADPRMRRIRKEAFRMLMSRLWKTMDSVVFKELMRESVALWILNEGDKRRVKEGLPWSFDQSVLVLKDMDKSILPMQMDFTRSPIWVQVHDMPLVCMNREVGCKIGETMGDVEEGDVIGDGVGWGRCLCIRINIDLTMPLDRGRALTLNSKSIWVSFKYEKPPQFCFKCERIFHAQNNCRGKIGFRLNDEETENQLGVWLRPYGPMSPGIKRVELPWLPLCNLILMKINEHH